jgi:hypothetical protein
MAKYVLLQFDHDEEADEFCQRFTEDVEERAKYQRVGIYAYVRGVFKKPTKFCECIGDMKKRAFTRGRKYGWWVCTKCGKPTPAWARGDHWFLALGRNLLPVDDSASEYRGDGVYGRYRKECPHCHSSCVATQGHGTCTVWCNKCQKYV